MIAVQDRTHHIPISHSEGFQRRASAGAGYYDPLTEQIMSYDGKEAAAELLPNGSQEVSPTFCFLTILESTSIGQIFQEIDGLFLDQVLGYVNEARWECSRKKDPLHGIAHGKKMILLIPQVALPE